MIQPSLESLRDLVEKTTLSGGHATTFAVHKMILADQLTPHAAYMKIARPGSPDAKPSFLMESAIGGERLDRYSFLGAGPRKIIRTGENFEGGAVDPLVLLEKELEPHEPANQPDVMPPFRGGAVGYVSYDCIKYFEPRTKRVLKDPLQIPEAALMLFDTIVAFDNVFQRIHIVHNIHVPQGTALEDFDISNAYAEAEKIIEDVVATLQGPEYQLPQGPVKVNDEYVSNIGREGYENHVKELQKHILLGDIIQAVPSQRVKHPTDLQPFNIYRHLRTVNPSPYLFYVDYVDFALIGASPEMLVKVENKRVVTHPIAGTVRRGKTVEEDNRLANELLASAKDRAEHVMLVDLARNDVNRICKPETSTVDRFMKLERFSHVTHIVSECSGQLRDDQTRFDAFRSIFPAGTVSGAPKVRAMELISELEGEVRGAYAGAVGCWGYDKGSMNTCIALRTMMYKDGYVYLQAGGGIVHDSDPYDEYVETMNKMKANRACLEEAEKIWQERTSSEAPSQ